MRLSGTRARHKGFHDRVVGWCGCRVVQIGPVPRVQLRCMGMTWLIRWLQFGCPNDESLDCGREESIWTLFQVASAAFAWG